MFKSIEGGGASAWKEKNKDVYEKTKKGYDYLSKKDLGIEEENQDYKKERLDLSKENKPEKTEDKQEDVKDIEKHLADKIETKKSDIKDKEASSEKIAAIEKKYEFKPSADVKRLKEEAERLRKEIALSSEKQAGRIETGFDTNSRKEKTQEGTGLGGMLGANEESVQEHLKNKRILQGEVASGLGGMKMGEMSEEEKARNLEERQKAQKEAGLGLGGMLGSNEESIKDHLKNEKKLQEEVSEGLGGMASGKMPEGMRIGGLTEKEMNPELILFEKLKKRYSQSVDLPQDLTPKDRYVKLFGEKEFSDEEDKLIGKLNGDKIEELGELRSEFFMKNVLGNNIVAMRNYYGSKERTDLNNSLTKAAGRVHYWKMNG